MILTNASAVTDMVGPRRRYKTEKEWEEYDLKQISNKIKREKSIRESIETAKKNGIDISVNGIVFNSYKEAADHFRISPNTVKRSIEKLGKSRLSELEVDIKITTKFVFKKVEPSAN